MRTRCAARLALLAALAVMAGCAEDALPTEPEIAPQLSAVPQPKQQQETATTTWNQRAITLLVALPNGSHAPASRILTYLSIAQYRAVLAADRGKHGSHPLERAAVGGASVVVLSSFFPASAAALETQLDADLAADNEKKKDHEAGEAIGRQVGISVLALAATDNFNTLSPGVPPVGPGFWVSSANPIVRSLYGTRPFFLKSGDQLRSPPPPAFGSPAFLASLAQVRAISDTRTPQQLAIAQKWNTATPPFTPGTHNLIADSLIDLHRRSERQAARILAFANAAAFDAQIACFDTKFAYWFIRPSQVDPAITLPIGLPNHPSYPSAYSCITASFSTVLKHAFPRERTYLEGNIEQAGLSRIYGGIHYDFDIDAGQLIGRQAARLALRGKLR